MTSNPSDTPNSPRNRFRWVILGLIGLALAGFYFGGGAELLSWQSIRGQLDAWQTFAQNQIVLACIIYFAIYVLVTAFSLPAASLLTLVAGALFGRWLGTVLACSAATVGATLAFLANRHLFRDWVEARFGSRLTAINAGLARDGSLYLLTLRLLPIIPFFVVNLLAGLTQLRTRTFAILSWFGMLPGTFLFVNAGTEIGRIQNPRDVLSASVLASLALLGLVPLIVVGVNRARRK